MADLVADGPDVNGALGPLEAALSAAQAPRAPLDGQWPRTGAGGLQGDIPPAANPVPEWLGNAHPGDTVIVRLPDEVFQVVEGKIAELRELNPAVSFLVVSEDASATIVPGDLRSEVRALLAATDAQWDDATGDGALSPDYLDRMADAVVAYLAERQEEAA